MKFTKIFAALIGALTMFAASGSALAQKNGILFLDQQRVISDSKAGKSIDQQLNALAQQVAAEISQEDAAIKKETADLQASQESLSKEDFGKRYQALLARAQRFEQFKQIRRAELEQARNKAITELAEAWEPISDEIFKKKKGYVLLEKQAVLSADDRGDITEEVIRALDKKLTTVAVVKPDLQAQIIAAAQAQQAQAAAAQAQQAQ